jgi:hypothetical protein
MAVCQSESWERPKSHMGEIKFTRIFLHHKWYYIGHCWTLNFNGRNRDSHGERQYTNLIPRIRAELDYPEYGSFTIRFCLRHVALSNIRKKEGLAKGLVYTLREHMSALHWMGWGAHGNVMSYVFDLDLTHPLRFTALSSPLPPSTNTEYLDITRVDTEPSQCARRSL